MNKKIAFVAVIGSYLLSISISYAAVMKNTTSFYLHLVNDNPGCPKMIAPGETANLQSNWCGYDACSTNQFKDGSCMEMGLSDDGSHRELRQGGYAAYFHPAPDTKTCEVPSKTYNCGFREQDGILNFFLDYNPAPQTYSAGPMKDQPVKLGKMSHFTQGPVYRGINVSGLEYDGTFLDAMFQRPDLADVKYFTEKNMNTIRLPIRWEFLVVDEENNLIKSTNPMSSHLNPVYLAAVKDTVTKYLKSGLNVVLDLHNYMRFCGASAEIGQLNEPTDPVTNHCQVVNGEQLAYIWGVIADEFTQLANEYPDQLIFEIMNEPYTHVDSESKQPVEGQIIKTEDLMKMEVQAVKAIRARGLNNYILLSGNYWDPLHDWTTHTVGSDVPNGDVFTAEKLKAEGIDNLDRIGIDMHQYFDFNYSGTHEMCTDFGTYEQFKQTLGLTNKDGVDVFKNWYNKNHMKLFLGEFGASVQPECQKALNYMLTYVNEHAYQADKNEEGGFIGWTIWRTNRHNGTTPFNFLQQADYNVWSAPGYPVTDGTGILQGPGNALMDLVLANYLKTNSN